MSRMPSISDVHLVNSNDGLNIVFGRRSPRRNRLSKRVLVVGGGVTGLTSAWVLLDAGYDVTIISERWASQSDPITSQIAGALWEWPPAVCGKHTNLDSLDKSKHWCMVTYRILEKLTSHIPADEHGARMRMSNFFFHKKLEDIPDQLEKMLEIASVTGIKGFEHDPNVITKLDINQQAGVVDSYRHLAPVIDTDQYMTWLSGVVASKKARFVTARITGDLLSHEDRLLARYGAHAIVNATGLGSYHLAADKTVTPLRGALIRVVNDGSNFPKVEQALAVSHDDANGADAEDIVFIVPRNNNVLILGGLVQPHVHSLDLTLESPEIVRMRQRCNNFVPGLENAKLDARPLVQGLRPFRGSNVRVEHEQRRKWDGSKSRIIHSYGQGGSGFTLSFGCAQDVLKFVSALEVEAPLPTMVRANM